jgi:hypothetical protein
MLSRGTDNLIKVQFTIPSKLQNDKGADITILSEQGIYAAYMDHFYKLTLPFETGHLNIIVSASMTELENTLNMVAENEFTTPTNVE